MLANMAVWLSCSPDLDLAPRECMYLRVKGNLPLLCNFQLPYVHYPVFAAKSLHKGPQHSANPSQDLLSNVSENQDGS